MKTSRLNIIVLLCAFLINCSKDETSAPKPDSEESENAEQEELQNTEPEVYFTFETHWVAEQTSDTDDAIMLHDDAGNLLDFKTFEGGDILEFTSASKIKPDNFTVSILRRATYSGPLEKNTIITYPNIQNKSVWTFKASGELPYRAQGNLIGGFNVTITELPEELLRFRISSYDSGRSQGEYTAANGLFTLHLVNLGLYEQNDFILSIVEKNGQKKYLKIKDVQPEDDLVFSYDEFLEYDHTIEIQLPSNYINQSFSQDVAEEQIESITRGGYYLDSFDAGKSSNPPNKFTLNFIDDLPTYRTSVVIFTEDYRYYYNKLGLRTDNIILRKPSYTVQNPSIFDFKFTTDVDYIFRESVWRTPYNPDLETIWSIVSPFEENPKINEIPERLSIVFPNMDLDNLARSVTAFRLRSISYSEYIQGRFNQDFPPMSPIYESEYYIVWD